MCQLWSLYLHPIRKYERYYKISKVGWFRVVRCHTRSLKITTFDRAHASLCSYLAPFLRYSEIWSQIADLNLLHLYLAPCWNVAENLESTGYRIMRCLRDLIFSRFGTILACDGQTDGKTDGHTTTAYNAQA